MKNIINKKTVELILLTVFLMCSLQSTSHSLFGGIGGVIGDIAGAVGDTIGAAGDTVGAAFAAAGEAVTGAAEAVGLSIRAAGTVFWHTDGVHSIEIFPNGGIIGVVVSNLVHLWDPYTQQTTATLMHDAPIRNIAVMSNGGLLASASEDGNIQLWNPNTETLQNVLNGHTEKVVSVAFSPDGTLLASASEDDTVRLWDPHAATLQATLREHTDNVLSIAFSPDGTLLASASADGTIRLWDPNTYTPQAKLTEHTDSVLDIIFSPDGTLLASASADGTIRLWDPNTHTLQSTFDHKAPVLSIAFSLVGEILACGSSDGAAYLWDIDTKQVIAKLGHESPVSSVAFSPDGGLLFSTSEDGNMRQWELTQGRPPIVTPGETNRSLTVSVTDFYETLVKKTHQIQLRRKAPQGAWITKCVSTFIFDHLGEYVFSTGFADLEPGITYEVRYRDTNASECTQNPPNPDLWSKIAEGTTHVVGPPRVDFIDANLATAVRRVLKLNTRGKHIELLKIPQASLAGITDLDLEGEKITDLIGLEHATQLTTLDLSENAISDIGPLAQLTQLIELKLDDNNISDITPLAQLTQLTSLNLTENQISDIAPLTQLIQLSVLLLGGNQIRDIGPLAQLTQLTDLNLAGNQISDIGPLAQLTQLTDLNFRNNQISDIGPLAQLTQLTDLDLVSNLINDIGPLARLTQLTDLNLVSNLINDIGPLAQLTQLTDLNLAGNQISDIGPLAQLTQLTDLNLRNNQISDIGPLAQLTQLTDLYLWNNPITDSSPLGKLLREKPRMTIEFDLPIFVAEPGSGPDLYVIKHGSILRFSLDRESVQVLVTGLDDPVGIALDVANGKIYWADAGTDKIQRSNLDGTNVQDLVTGLDIPSDIALDVANGKIYWTDYGTDKIQRANLDGTNVQDLVEFWTAPPYIALDVANDKIYWKRYGNKIERANLDGTNVQNVTIEWSRSEAWDITLSSSLKFTPHTSVTFSSVQSAAIGEQLEFSLNIADGEAVAGYQATVQFDDTVLRYVSSTNGNFLPAGGYFVQPVVEGNLIKLNAASLAGESNGAGTLATLTFEVIAVKESTLTLSDVLLTNSAGEGFVPNIENTQITEPARLKGDVNGDGTVDIRDLVLVASSLDQAGQNPADVNGDGIVDIRDLVLVAGALGTSAAAPSLRPQALEMLTVAEVKLWLSQAQHITLMDTTSQRGILFLERLLAALIPNETTLLANFPNPFNPETWIPYQLASGADVTLTIYDSSGRMVRRLRLGHRFAGHYADRGKAAYWDGCNDLGEKVASGVYFYQLRAGDYAQTRKMLIRK